MAQIISGTILEVLEVKQGTSKSGNAWQKQAFAITTGGMFPDTIAFELFGDRIGQFAHLLHKDNIVAAVAKPKNGRGELFHLAPGAQHVPSYRRAAAGSAHGAASAALPAASATSLPAASSGTSGASSSSSGSGSSSSCP